MEHSADAASIERLEHRIEALEALVRDLAASRDRVAPAGGLAPPTPDLGAPAALKRADAPAGTARADVVAATVAKPVPPGPLSAQAWRVEDVEQWVGARGLLLVGVVALLAAAGFLLKYAFDHGWVAPWLRATSAVVSGAALAWFGERRAQAGIRNFGLAMIGAGGGLAYLGIWSAAGPYALLDRRVGVVLVAALAGLLAWRAVAYHAEPLTWWALLGAFSAPVLLPTPDARPEALLAYLAVVCMAAGVLAHTLAWRRTLLGATVGFFLLPAMAIPVALGTPVGFAYLAIGGLGALRFSHGHDWREVRITALCAAWGLLVWRATGVADAGAAAAAMAAATALTLRVWWHHRGSAEYGGAELSAEPVLGGIRLLAAPAALVLVAGMVYDDAKLAAAAAALLYLGTGWKPRWAPFVAAGLALAAAAVMVSRQDEVVVVAWSAMALLAVVADVRARQHAGAPAAPLLVGAALFGLVVRLIERNRADPAFVGHWSLALYLTVGLAAAAALAWRSRASLPVWARSGQRSLWLMVGTALLAGITVEIARYFRVAGGPPWSPSLAGALSISLYWLVYAAVVVAIGFRLNQRDVRTAGLAVAAGAAGKILLVDLRSLDALYRVASFFALALIALAVAYAYNRRAAREAAAGPAGRAPKDEEATR
jgi:uncharacterized membrane protein